MSRLRIDAARSALAAEVRVACAAAFALARSTPASVADLAEAARLALAADSFRLVADVRALASVCAPAITALSHRFPCRAARTLSALAAVVGSGYPSELDLPQALVGRRTVRTPCSNVVCTCAWLLSRAAGTPPWRARRGRPSRSAKGRTTALSARPSPRGRALSGPSPPCRRRSRTPPWLDLSESTGEGVTVVFKQGVVASVPRCHPQGA